MGRGTGRGRRGGGRRSPVPAVEEGARASDRAPSAAERARNRARSAQASRVILHTLIWVLVVFYATDYLPPLAVRGLAPAGTGPVRVYATGYLVLALVCVLHGLAFGLRYGPAIIRSRYPQRWLIFPTVLAVLLIPAQGWNEWLTRAVEVAACLVGIGVGLRSHSRWRWRSRPRG